MARKGIYMTTYKNNPNRTKSFSVNLAPSRRRASRRKRYNSDFSDFGIIGEIIGIIYYSIILIPVLLLLIWLFPKFFAMVGIGLATWITYEIGCRIYSRWGRG